MLNFTIIILGKTLSKLAQVFNLGNGSTWPGHIALSVNKNFIREILKDSSIKTIFIAGTNGKTTTAKLIRSVLEESGQTVFQNESGANLLNGIASALIVNTNASGKLTQHFAIFEIDENTLPLILHDITPDYLILMNLFRDQLDRYGEVNTIVQKWKHALSKLPEKTKIIANADDPQVAFLGMSSKNHSFFGLSKSDRHVKQLQQAADSVSCPKCGTKLSFTTIFFSHLGIWHCEKCKIKRPSPTVSSYPFYPLTGLYNYYNSHAAVLALQQIGLKKDAIEKSLNNFEPAFGRQEIIAYKSKQAQIFLSKNPTSFNQSYATIKDLQAKILLVVLNDRIPDGRDISWIWDVDFPDIEQFDHILVAGDRAYDMALRIKYEGYKNTETFEDLDKAVNTGFELLTTDEMLYILPTYSAMLEVRKILTGKKIL